MAGGMKIKKGDRVEVIAGRDKGRRGEVLQALPRDRKVVVQGVNMVKKHQKPSYGGPGGIVEKEAPIAVSNVAMLDPKEDRPTRVGRRILEDGRKVRVARRSGDLIDS